MQYTKNLKLPLFEESDLIRHEDFNSMAEILDSSTATQSQISAAQSQMSTMTTQINAILVKGMIMMWSGAASAIPSGWALCNGSNGTPDLRGRFVLGAGGTYSVDAKGGEETHTLTSNEMPTHSHTIAAYDIYTQSSSTMQGYGTVGALNARTAPSTSETGGGAAHNNMPPYYALCYIMKL